MKKRYLLLLLSVLLISCHNNEAVKQTDINGSTENNNSISSSVNNSTITETQDPPSDDVTQDLVDEPEVIEEPVEEIIDYQALYKAHQVNELGQVMVIMYHDLADQAGSYATTIELFKGHLNRLYDEGYRTVSMSDFVNNTINIPLGTTPIILTFDDATKSNFFYDESGEISKESVVGILDEFALAHEDFGKNAIFYVYGKNPFRESALIEDKLTYLLSEGYEIGNHSYDHDKLNELDASGIQNSLGREQLFIKTLMDYDMQHVSLPYGLRPSETLFEYVFEGQYDTLEYKNISAVNVGWNPTKSPAHINFNARSINRVTCGDEKFELDYWLDYFVENPSKKYISDGDADTVVIPSASVEYIAEDYLDKMITYDEED